METSPENSQPNPAASANPLHEEMMKHLLAENAFLRAQVEQHARAEAELRAALRESVRAMPKAITSGAGEDKPNVPAANTIGEIEERIATTIPAISPMSPASTVPSPHAAPTGAPPVGSTPAPAVASDEIAEKIFQKPREKPQRIPRPIVAPPLATEEVYEPRRTPGQPVALHSAMNELSRRRTHRSLWKKMLGMR